ncbi:DUF4244 domain-containing protein [Streptomyces xanthochromogenes]|uniref:DUF4244 domain-containing protein n=2 Tax=Streptomyces TaxID=1883 RepID=A0ABQ2ZW39_9ACTN|nr:DUF4244 domain-containing protein [Streptomyces sp. SID1034]GGY27632.1 hypothetical protein GCM10010326_21490 [Streptomyces xanthochromogenes]GHB43215.1 hypothetical protein GCM10010331_33480 [Streptomyces xanthochromogenes]
MNAIVNRQMDATVRRMRRWNLTVRRRVRGDAGMSTSEYAVGTLAACAFAAILYKVVTSDGVVTALTGLVTRALDVQF